MLTRKPAYRLPRAVGLSVVLSLAASPVTLAGPSAPPALSTLDPGATITLRQELPVNIVFLGYDAGAGDQQVDVTSFMEGLPSTYDTRYRLQAYYGLPALAHVAFDYDYNVVFADSTYEDSFFGYLASIAVPMPLTIFQEGFNIQAARSLDVTGNAWIDAPSVERWLADNPLAGVDTTEYTIFFIDWYSRPDFQFHVYTKTDEPDPDTGYNYGLQPQFRKMIAWGGTTPDDEESGLGSLHRIWFYDLSAGPESWSGNWDLTHADLTGDGELDYRMPPVWEYGNVSAYRPFDDLSGDLARVARYVALDLLFTTSPFYPPGLSPPALPDSIQVDINVFNNEPGFDPLTIYDTALIAQELSELRPDNTITVELHSARWNPRLRDAYGCFIRNQSCYGARLWGYAAGDLFLYFRDHILGYVEGDADYEVDVFGFNGATAYEAPLTGLAEQDYITGAQSFVFEFSDPARRGSGQGFTGTTIHEVGHHFGLSHPHDGYDSESGVDFFGRGDFYFAWSGDESNTVMSYLEVNWDFSQFDRDNMSRYMTSAYLNEANAVLGLIVASPRAGAVASYMLSADASASAAMAQYAAFDWSGAATSAKDAYDSLMAAAAKIDVPIEPESSPADVKSAGLYYAFTDPVRTDLLGP